MRLLNRPWRRQPNRTPPTHWLMVEFPRDFPLDPTQWPSLRNVGPEAAYHVEIEPIRRGRFCATFPPLRDLEPGSPPVPLRPITTRDGERDKQFSESRNDWFAVLLSFDTRRKLETLAVPLTMRFQDEEGRPHLEVHCIRCARPGMHFEADA